MTDEKLDRRVQRTRDLLKTALIQLVDEKGYDAVTIQDITDRANVGRSTFYLHYESKDDLFLDHHIDFVSQLILRRFSYADLMDETPPAEYERFLQMLADDKQIYFAITKAKDAELIMRGVRGQLVDGLLESLKAAFPETHPTLPLEMLANYLVGSQLSLIDWWLSNRTVYSANDVAKTLHQLHRAAICSAYGLKS